MNTLPPWRCVVCADWVLPLRGQQLEVSRGHAHRTCAPAGAMAGAPPTAVRTWTDSDLIVWLDEPGLLHVSGSWGTTSAAPDQWRARRRVRAGATIFRGHPLTLGLGAHPRVVPALLADRRIPTPVLALCDLIGGRAHLWHPEVLERGTLRRPTTEDAQGDTWTFFVGYDELLPPEVDVALDRALGEIGLPRL